MFDDGTKTFCEMFRAMMRWQSEGFCFQSTGLNANAQGALNPTTLKDQWGLPHAPEPVRDPRAGFPGCERYNAPDYVDDFNDGYAVVPIELDYKTVAGQAYFNESTGLKISHYPVVHTRAGSIGFKVEWNGLSMLYSSDTKPEWNSVRLGDGVDVYIHEMAVPPEIWAMKIQGLSQPGEGPEWQAMLDWTKRVQDSSHTTPGAFGYMLSQMNQLPRLVVPTHFITADDTVNCALESIRAHVPGIGRLGEKIAWSYDLMVLRVYKDRVVQCRAVVDDYSVQTHSNSIPAADQAPPKYYLLQNGGKVANPMGQLDPDAGSSRRPMTTAASTTARTGTDERRGRRIAPAPFRPLHFRLPPGKGPARRDLCYKRRSLHGRRFRVRLARPRRASRRCSHTQPLPGPPPKTTRCASGATAPRTSCCRPAWCCSSRSSSSTSRPARGAMAGLPRSRRP